MLIPDFVTALKNFWLRQITGSELLMQSMKFLQTQLDAAQMKWLHNEAEGYPHIGEPGYVSHTDIPDKQKYRLVYIDKPALIIDSKLHPLTLKGPTPLLQWLDWPLSQVEKAVDESKDGFVRLPFQLPEYSEPGVQPVYLIQVSQLQRVTECFREEFLATVKGIPGIENLDK